MDRRAAVAAATALALTGVMPAVSAGLLPEPGLDRPAWYLLVALCVGYWVAAVRWARGGGE
jgi:hypothetical protein